MEVILIQDLANLGFKNDIVKVRDGYGRNYLLPQQTRVTANSWLRTSNSRLTKQLRSSQMLRHWRLSWLRP